jgi:glycosyltransferase involved in cell wall biosynthesis
MSIVLVTGTLTPYNRRLYDAFAGTFGETLFVLACTGREPHRSWQVAAPDHFVHEVLPGLRRHVSDLSHIYVNPAVIGRLRRIRPEVIAVGGFSPTMALAVAYARATGTPYGIATDGAPSTDPGEASRPHRLMRQAMVPRARFGICASEESVRLLAQWGLDPACSTVVPLVPAWDALDDVPGYDARPFDVLFAGTLNEEIKGALFFCEVVARMSERRPGLRVRVTGEGPARAEMQVRLAALGVVAEFDGALQPAAMMAAFASAKLMLFPSRADPWGLVANEAVHCGTPVLGSPHAISSACYLERFGLGLMRPLEVEAWTTAALEMLATRERWHGFMARRSEALAWASLAGSARALKRAFDLGRGRVVAAETAGHHVAVPGGRDQPIS